MSTHGITIDRQTGGVRPVETVEGAAIGIMASASEMEEGDLFLLRSGDDITDYDDGTGTLTAIMNVIRRHTNAPVVVNVLAATRLDPLDEDYEAPTGGAATYTLAYRFLQAEVELGVRPRLLAQALVPANAGDLTTVALRLLAQVYIDGPNTSDAAAITAAGTATASARVGFCDPAVVDDTDKVVGSSVYYAAIASTLNFWESASNIPLIGVKRLSRSISFAMGDPDSQAQDLNDAKINTIIREQGFRLWGGLSLSADTFFKFLAVGRTDDIIAESMQRSFLYAVDKGITRTFVADLVETINAFIRDLKARGAIIDGKAWADPALNTQTSLGGGNLFIDYEFTPIYPAHAITLRRHLTNAYLSQIFG